jgi:periplasmic copper chaperone A
MRPMLLVCALAGVAQAHPSIASGPATANKSQVITMSLGHGCTDANDKHLDTVKIRIQIPTGVTSVRAMRSDFGKPSVVKDNGVVTAIEWTKPTSELLDDDDGFYEFKFRARVPDAPYSKLKFVVIQTCQNTSNNATLEVPWDQDEGATTGEPAPFLTVVPAHSMGWTKLTVSRALTQDDVATYFGDAAIVWHGTAAYSPNANTAAMIKTTPGVTPLDGLAANDEIWVKY